MKQIILFTHISHGGTLQTLCIVRILWILSSHYNKNIQIVPHSHYDTSAQVYVKSTLVFLSLLSFDLYSQNMVINVFY